MTNAELPSIGSAVSPRFDARLMLNPNLLNAPVPMDAFSMESNFARMNARLEQELPEVKLSMIDYEGTVFAMYGKASTLHAVAQETDAGPICQSMSYISSLDREHRASMCIYVSKDLVKAGVAQDYLFILPRTADNIRGNTGFHYVAGSHLTGERYAYVDGTWPYADDEDRQQGMPWGIFIVGENESEAHRIAALIYGGEPRKEKLT